MVLVVTTALLLRGLYVAQTIDLASTIATSRSPRTTCAGSVTSATAPRRFNANSWNE